MLDMNRVLTQDEILDDLIRIEEEGGVVDDATLDLVSAFPTVDVPEVVEFDVAVNTMHGAGDSWEHVGVGYGMHEALGVGTEACYDSDEYRKVHISHGGLTAFYGVFLPGGLQGNFANGYKANS